MLQAKVQQQLEANPNDKWLKTEWTSARQMILTKQNWKLCFQ